MTMRLIAKCYFALAATLLLISCGGGNQDSRITPSSSDKRMTASSVGAQVASEGLSVAAAVLVAERRVSRTVYEYEFALTVANASDKSYSNVRAELVAAGSGTTVISGVLLVGALAPRTYVTPSSLITVRHDRLSTFNRAALS